ncbi:hypothetical protein D9M68_800820 [compost metagenome]
MSLEDEAGDDPEIAAATPERPEEVRVLGGAGGPERAIGQHDICRDKIVYGQATLPCQIAGAAAKRQPADPGGRDDAEGHGEAKGMCRMVDVARGAARLDAHRCAGQVHMDSLHA